MLLSDFPISPWAIEHREGFLATLLGFIVLALLIWRFVGPGARSLFTGRTNRIVETHEQADRVLADAVQIRNDYATRIADIESEHRQRLAAAVRDADAARAAIIADAHEAARALRRRTEEEIARERGRQRILMRRQIVGITVDAAEQAILDLNSESTQHKLIDDFVQRVGSGDVGGGGARGFATEGELPSGPNTVEAVTPLRGA